MRTVPRAKEPPNAPWFGGERVDDLESASPRLLVGLVHAVAHVDGDRCVVGGGGLAGDELDDRAPVGGPEPPCPSAVAWSSPTSGLGSVSNPLILLLPGDVRSRHGDERQEFDP